MSVRKRARKPQAIRLLGSIWECEVDRGTDERHIRVSYTSRWRVYFYAEEVPVVFNWLARAKAWVGDA